MLGIRRLKGVSLDLWCGPEEDFVRDRTVDLEHDLHFNPDEHLGILWAESLCPENMIQKLRATLDGSSERPRRITFIFATLLEYKRFQGEFFRLL